MRLLLAYIKIPMIFIYSAPKTHTKRTNSAFFFPLICINAKNVVSLQRKIN